MNSAVVVPDIEARQAPDLHVPGVLLSIRDLHLAYDGVTVLNGIDLDVKRGQAVSIIGPSGSGKSTILRCINGLVKPQRGTIHIDGTEVVAQQSEAERTALRKRVGFVFQQYNLFPHLSVLDNLTIAPRRVLGKSRAQAESEAHALLAKVRLADKARAYPGALSGGAAGPDSVRRSDVRARSRNRRRSAQRDRRTCGGRADLCARHT
jgi:polar amino acid transport system ATP-binding protein